MKKQNVTAAPGKASKRGLQADAILNLLTAWAEWHDHSDQMPSLKIINAMGGLFDVMGLTFKEGKDGKHVVVKARKAAGGSHE